MAHFTMNLRGVSTVFAVSDLGFFMLPILSSFPRYVSGNRFAHFDYYSIYLREKSAEYAPVIGVRSAPWMMYMLREDDITAYFEPESCLIHRIDIVRFGAFPYPEAIIIPSWSPRWLTDLYPLFITVAHYLKVCGSPELTSSNRCFIG